MLHQGCFNIYKALLRALSRRVIQQAFKHFLWAMHYIPDGKEMGIYIFPVVGLRKQAQQDGVILPPPPQQNSHVAEQG